MTEICSLNVFKGLLDKFLASVPDETLVRGNTAYRRADTNSLLDMVRFATAQSLPGLDNNLMLEVATHGHLRNSPKNYPQVSTSKWFEKF